MMSVDLKPTSLETLQHAFGDRLQVATSLARFTAARIGGPADALLEVRSKAELVEVIGLCWRDQIPYVILGGGSNVLVSDAGVHALVVVNRARKRHFNDDVDPPTVWAESGAGFGSLARQAAQRGLGGLEWAAGIPGTLGGAVIGNAGAHGSDMAGNLLLAEILHHSDAGGWMDFQSEKWMPERLAFAYRSSIFKRQPGKAVVLAALLRLERCTPDKIQARMDEFAAYRRRTQPPGASMGSMFKNPPGDYAGRLIDAAGLKGTRVGQAEISHLHANFIINLGGASAADIYSLLRLARRAVAESFGVNLELEIELLGDW